ncbi:hypothetical protein OG594_22305 [Streptomyces sp. NBC_01214]|uniref:hypothetical protein n=1 Tax=Streptomyces sp. NBC_01214 TaxID=2903777 RepID=UPI00224DB72D|nr:hypothetical protein [Streptomyces sp. NBC_01214]MCX4804342.1 hypothetical protein [Streptomyces sp. NBC_01214]
MGPQSHQSFRKAYNGSQARYVARFLSKDYLAKPYPMDEFMAMLVPSTENPDDYILPVTIGDVVIPQELLGPAVGFLQCDDYTADELARASSRGSRAPAVPGRRGGLAGRQHDAGAAHARADSRELQQVPGAEWSFCYLTEQFKVAAPLMGEFGFVYTVRNSQSEVRVRVERHGRILYGIDIRFGAMGRGDVLNFVLAPRGWYRYSNGTASATFDRAAGVPKPEMHNLSVFGMTPSVTSYTKEELFEELWNRLVDEVQRVTGGH